MAVTQLNEPVKVLASFGGGDFRPVIMRFSGKRHPISKLNMHHTKREGDDVLHYFSVSTDMGDCILCYSKENIDWTLIEVSFDG